MPRIINKTIKDINDVKKPFKIPHDVFIDLSYRKYTVYKPETIKRVQDTDYKLLYYALLNSVSTTLQVPDDGRIGIYNPYLKKDILFKFNNKYIGTTFDIIKHPCKTESGKYEMMIKLKCEQETIPIDKPKNIYDYKANYCIIEFN
jgi:hypothetical protein